jgi:ribosome-interacting GTPase 1
MPANLPPQYFEAEKRYRIARTPQEKIHALEDMLRIMPKHKGTDKLQAELKRKISKLRSEASKRSSGARRSDHYYVEKTGAGQVVMAGPPNVGKSKLLAALSNARPEVADYPFTTRLPQTGMMLFENVQIQVVDLPPIHPELTEAWVFAMLRNADALWIVLDLNEDAVLDHMELLLEQLEQANIIPLMRSQSFEDDQHLSKKSLIVCNKMDLPRATDHLEILEELYGNRYQIIQVSAQSGAGLGSLQRATFDILGVIRVYTKTPGKEPDLNKPVILPQGSTVLHCAEQIHKDFAQKLKFARIWGENKHKGQRVQRDYPLEDGDVIELHL